jgi:hypothetical protein
MKRTPQPSFIAQVNAIRLLATIGARTQSEAAATATQQPGDTNPVPSNERKAA